MNEMILSVSLGGDLRDCLATLQVWYELAILSHIPAKIRRVLEGTFLLLYNAEVKLRTEDCGTRIEITEA